jgi:hypothetical protein
MQTPGWSGVAVTLALLTFTQSPSTMAAVAVFTANVERTWPADDREPFVTLEALRLMEAAVAAVATDRKVDNPKLKQSIDAFTAVRAELEPAKIGSEEKPPVVREALIKGVAMIEALAGAVRREDATTKSRLSELKKSADALDRKRKLSEQGDVLQRYFHEASELLKALGNFSMT